MPADMTDLTWITDCEMPVTATYRTEPSQENVAPGLSLCAVESLMLWVPDGGPVVTLTLVDEGEDRCPSLFVNGQYEYREDFFALLGCFETAREQSESCDPTDIEVHFIQFDLAV